MRIVVKREAAIKTARDKAGNYYQIWCRKSKIE